MFLISWNVAGWSSTSQAIRESYGSLHDFFACTGADIICLQECKGTQAKLNASPVDMGASDPPPNRRPIVRPLTRLTSITTPELQSTGGGSGSGGVNDGIEGWESFWSFSGKQHRGFNGVVTFARKGLTWRCDNRPFAEEEFNEEGRVVVTHHSAFVLVNVYVPNARGGARHDYKFSFLRALENLMEKLRRETEKPVMLVGDLNMTYRAFDGAWSLRRIHLGTLLQLEAFAAEKSDAEWTAALPHLPKPALQRVIHLISNYLCARVMEVASSPAAHPGNSPISQDGSSVPSPTCSPLSPQKSHAALSSTVSAPSTGVVSVDAALVVDGDTIDSAALHRLCQILRAEGYQSAGGSSSTSNNVNGSSTNISSSNAGSGGGRMTQMYEAPPVSLRDLYAAGFRNAYASEFAKSFNCAHNNELYAVVRYCGLSPHSDASAGVMGRLLHLPLPRSAASVLSGRLPWKAPSAATVDTAINGKDAIADAPAEYSHTRMFDSFLLTDKLLQTYAAATQNRGGGDGKHDLMSFDAALLAEVEQPQLHPYCPCPYTVWDQSRNRRLENVGTRLDYILVDAALLPAVVCREESANSVFPTGPNTPSAAQNASREDFFSEVSGLQCRDGAVRAMAGGAYPPAPFDGSGMPALAEGARELCCADLPATGLFVTPPQFSDHIGVGLVLDLHRLGGSGELTQRPGKLAEDHKCMYRPPVGLHTFFAAAAAAKKSAPAVASPAATAAPSAGSTAGQKRTAGEDQATTTMAISGGPTCGSKMPTKAARTEEAPALGLKSTEKEERAAEVIDVDEL